MYIIFNLYKHLQLDFCINVLRSVDFLHKTQSQFIGALIKEICRKQAMAVSSGFI